MPTLLSLIGPNASACTPEIYAFGEELGHFLINQDYWMVCGGKGGFMEAICKGAHQAEAYTFGCTIGILPEADRSLANPYCDIVIPSGMGLSRNFLVANTGEKVIAVAGGAGTLSEMAYAWQLNKEIIAYEGFGGWAEQLAGQRLDARRPSPIKKARSLDELKQLL